MAGLGDIFGSSGIGPQFLLWDVGGVLAGALLAPPTTLIAQNVWHAAVNDGIFVVLDPATLADMVVRNYVDQDSAANSATYSGVSASDFALMVDNAGEAPGPELLAAAELRGGVLGSGTGAQSTSYDQGIAESRLKDKWSAIIKTMALEWPSPLEFIDAAVRNQMTTEAATTAYEQAGGDPQWFTLRYDVRGNPPSPTQLLELVRRGIIAENGTGPNVLSLEQGISESDQKDKWYPAYQALLDYIPPPRTVTALYREGSMSAADAAKWFIDAGMSPALAQTYIASASGLKLAGTKHLAEGLVLTLYESQTISNGQAITYLTDLGYSATEAAYVLEIQDLKYEISALNSAVKRIGTLYTHHKITRPAAVSALTELGASQAYSDRMFAIWDLEVSNEVVRLTKTDIELAYHYAVMTEDQAMTELQNLGYTPFDAWAILSIRANAPLPNEPAQGPAGPAVNP